MGGGKTADPFLQSLVVVDVCRCLSYIAHPMEDLNSPWTDTIQKSPVVEEHDVQEILIVYVRRKLIAVAASRVTCRDTALYESTFQSFF